MNITKKASRILTQTHGQHIDHHLPKILPDAWEKHLTQRERWRWTELITRFGFCRAKASLVRWASFGDWDYMGVATLVKHHGDTFCVVYADGRLFARSLGPTSDSNRFEVLNMLENGCLGFPSLASTNELEQHQMLRQDLYEQSKINTDFGVLLSLGELYLSEAM